MITNISTI